MNTLNWITHCTYHCVYLRAGVPASDFSSTVAPSCKSPLIATATRSPGFSPSATSKRRPRASSVWPAGRIDSLDMSLWGRVFSVAYLNGAGFGLKIPENAHLMAVALQLRDFRPFVPCDYEDPLVLQMLDEPVLPLEAQRLFDR